MAEKYKIYLSEDLKSRLIFDAELFEFYKKDGSVNLNAFLKALLTNYFEQYRHGKEKLLRSIRQEIADTVTISDKDAAALAAKIVRTYLKEELTPSGKSASITLTVSGESLDMITVIENNLLKETSLSQYLKDMFATYLSIPRSSRESIIFKDTFERVSKAISGKRLVSFNTTTADNYTFLVEPYMIAPSKEEQCNYLICNDVQAGHPSTFRISRMTSVFITSDRFEIDSALYEELREKSLRSPQSVSKTVRAVVKFTPFGVRKFHMVTKNRPDVIKKEGDLYYFDWSELQLEEYFKRFGRDAVVLEPDSLRNRLIKHYTMALRAYKQ